MTNLFRPSHLVRLPLCPQPPCPLPLHPQLPCPHLLCPLPLTMPPAAASVFDMLAVSVVAAEPDAADVSTGLAGSVVLFFGEFIGSLLAVSGRLSVLVVLLGLRTCSALFLRLFASRDIESCRLVEHLLVLEDP